MVAALEALRQYGLATPGGQNPSEKKVIAGMITPVLEGLKAALEHPDSHAIERLLSRQQLLEFARIFLIQAAKTPGMIAGTQSELQAIVRGAARCPGRLGA